MNIALISRGIPNSFYPTHGIFELDQASALVKAGHDVKMLVVDMRSIRRWRHWGYSRVDRDGVDCHIISIPLGRVSHSLYCSIGAKALERLYNKAYKNGEKPDIIHAHFTRQGRMAANLAQKHKLPLVITEHYSVMNQEHIQPDLLKMAKEAYSAADRVIAVSSALKNSIMEKTGIDSIVIPNIVDTDMFCPADKPKKNKEIFTFVSAAHFIKRKRMDLLVSAFAEFYKKYPGSRLVVFGGGQEEDKIRSLVSENKLEDVVILRGLVGREEIAEEYKKSDAFALLSANETFGVVYIEALAAGMPVIATKCGGPDEFMCEDFGYYIDVDNKEQAVNAMIGLYENYDNYSSEKISETIRKMFSPEAISKQLTDIYKNVIERRL